MSEAVICIVPSESQANMIVESLRNSGFRNVDVSVLMPDKNLERDLGHEKHSKAPEGVSTGAGTGALLGGALGWLTGIGALAIPGLGAFIAAGPIMSMLGGVAVGTSVGGVVGGLIGLGIPEYEAKQFETHLRDGNILLSVHTETGDQAKLAQTIFEKCGGRDIKRTSETAVKSK